MITIQMRVPFTSGLKFADQRTQIETTDLRVTEMIEPTGLTLIDDLTTWAGGFFFRTIRLTETPEFLQNLGLPLTPSKRRSAVEGMFPNILAARVKKDVFEIVSLT